MEWASANWSGGTVDPATGPTAADNYVGSTGNTAISLNGDRAVNSFLQSASQTSSMLIVSSNVSGGVSSVFTVGDLTNASSQLLTFRNGATGNSLSLAVTNLGISGSANIALGSSGAEANAIRSLSVSGATTITSNAKLLINVLDAEYSLGLINMSAGEINLNHSATTKENAATVHTTGISGTGGVIQNATTNASNTSTLVVRNATNHATGTALINGVGKLSVTKEGSGRQTLNAANTYTGLTSVKEGVLEIGTTGSLTDTSVVEVSAGATFVYNNRDAALSAPVVLAGDGRSNRARLAGNGTIDSAVVLDNTGDVLSAGDAGVGVLQFARGQSWSSFSYEWSIADFTGTVAGADFDQILIDGALNLTGGAGSYVLDLQSVDAAGSFATVANFSPNEADRSWVILTATGGISGFDASQWEISLGTFLTDESIAGQFSLDVVNNDLVLTYTVPEPASVGFILGVGVLTVACARRIRTQRVKAPLA